MTLKVNSQNSRALKTKAHLSVQDKLRILKDFKDPLKNNDEISVKYNISSLLWHDIY
jgi:hypothetical protein